MIELVAPSVAVLILCLLGLIVLPSRRADSNVRMLRTSVTFALGLQAILALLLTLSVAYRSGESFSLSLFRMSPDAGIEFGAYVDGTSCLMLLMVSIVGFVVSRYSIRYLDGEAMQGRYFRWLGFTAGAVSLMVVAGNALLLFGAWVMTSMGLHQLLLHYRHRKAAHHAAWTKFAISRLGDAFLISALILIYRTYGTFDLATLFQQANDAASSGAVGTRQILIGWCLVLGAVTKSAQFPFHTWLPNTMETPTPVSALMHAGIVNAGGYLVIRTSPLVALAPNALGALAAIGGFTAFFASVVMMTQTSIKRSLAYSTIAQMGFMMLQCGLGAFSAAMLHILAHSFYKAHAFLSSGSVVAESQVTKAPASHRLSWTTFAMAAVLAVVAFSSAGYLLGVDLTSKSGGLALAFILCLALTTWGWRLLEQSDQKSVFTAVVGVAGLCLCYLSCYTAISVFLGPAIATVENTWLMNLVMFDVALAFGILFLLHRVLRNQSGPKWLEQIRIHASNGFYIDVVYRRIFRGLAKA